MAHVLKRFWLTLIRYVCVFYILFCQIILIASIVLLKLWTGDSAFIFFFALISQHMFAIFWNITQINLGIPSLALIWMSPDTLIKTACKSLFCFVHPSSLLFKQSKRRWDHFILYIKVILELLDTTMSLTCLNILSMLIIPLIIDTPLNLGSSHNSSLPFWCEVGGKSHFPAHFWQAD